MDANTLDFQVFCGLFSGLHSVTILLNAQPLDSS